LKEHDDDEAASSAHALPMNNASRISSSVSNSPEESLTIAKELLSGLVLDSPPSRTEMAEEGATSPPQSPVAPAEAAPSLLSSPVKLSRNENDCSSGATDDANDALHYDVQNVSSPSLPSHEPWQDDLIAPNDMAANLAHLIEVSEADETPRATCGAVKSATSAEIAAPTRPSTLSTTGSPIEVATAADPTGVNAASTVEGLPTSPADTVAASGRSPDHQKSEIISLAITTSVALTPRRAAKQALDERARIKQSLLQPSRVLPSRARSTGRLLMGPPQTHPVTSSLNATAAAAAGGTSALPPARAAAIAADGLVLQPPPSLLRRSSSCSPERGGGGGGRRGLSPKAAAAARALGLPVHGTAIPSGRPIPRKRAASTGRALSGKKLLAEEVARLAVKKGGQQGDDAQPQATTGKLHRQPQEIVKHNQEHSLAVETYISPTPAAGVKASDPQESSSREAISNSTTNSNATPTADSHAVHQCDVDAVLPTSDGTKMTAKEVQAAAAADTKRLMDAARVAREKKEAAKAEKQRLEVQRLKDAIAAAHAQEKVQNAQEAAAKQEAASEEAGSKKTTTEEAAATTSSEVPTENALPPQDDVSLSHSLDDFDLCVNMCLSIPFFLSILSVFIDFHVECNCVYISCASCILSGRALVK